MNVSIDAVQRKKNKDKGEPATYLYQAHIFAVDPVGPGLGRAERHCRYLPRALLQPKAFLTLQLSSDPKQESVCISESIRGEDQNETVQRQRRLGTPRIRGFPKYQRRESSSLQRHRRELRASRPP